MNSGAPVLLLWAGLLTAVPLMSCAQPQGDDARPNILLVTVSQLSPHALDPSWRDDVESPALDRLTSDGVAFSDCWAPSQDQGASLASLLTGLVPRDHGVLLSFYDLGDEARTLHAELQESGYRTGGFTGLLPAMEFTGFRRGFDTFDAPSVDDDAILIRSWPNERVVASALNWLASTEESSDDPWFCWVRLGKGPMPRGELTELQLRNVPPGTASPPVELGVPIENPTHELFELYYRLALAGLDGHLAPLVDFAEGHGGARLSGTERDVVVVLTALAGEDDPHTGPREPGWHVPLLFHGAGVGAEAGPHAPVSLLDVAPSLRDMAGLPPLDPGGYSLRDASIPTERLLVHETHYLDRGTDVLVRIADEILWVDGGLAGMMASRPGLNWHSAPDKPAAVLTEAYESWRTKHGDPSSLRDSELEEWWRARLIAAAPAGVFDDEH